MGLFFCVICLIFHQCLQCLPWNSISYCTATVSNKVLSKGRAKKGSHLVFTYHPLSSRIKHILLNNFNILMSDPTTAAIFPASPVVPYRRSCSLRDLLVHTSDRCVTDEPGTFACEHPPCRTCQYTTSDVHVRGPKCSTTIHEHLNRRCSRLYIGETGRSLRERFGEHLRSVEKNTPGFPVAEHFNSPGHTL